MKTLLVVAVLALTLPAFAVNYTDWTQPFDVDANTMGLWHFDEQTGDATVTDATGQSPDGTFTGGLDANLTWQTSMFGFGNMASTWWNSSSDFNYGRIEVVCPGDVSLDPLAVGADQDVTIEFWAKLQYGNYRVAVDKNLSDYWVGFGVASAGDLDVGWYGDGAYTSETSGITGITGAWHHYAVCIDRTSSSNDIVTFWLDGVQQGAAITDASPQLAGPTGNLSLLADYGGGHVFLGDLDEVRISSVIRYGVIPEPSTVSLLAIGLVSVLRRKK